MREIQRLAFLVSICACSFVPLHAQQTVCDLFKDLPAADGRKVVLTGDLVISKDITELGAGDCDNQYRANHFIYPVALRLQPSPAVSPRQLADLKEASDKADALRKEGKGLAASAIVTGRMELSKGDDVDVAGILTFDSIDSIRIEELPAPEELPVVSICDLFQNLQAWKGKRIAVRGASGSTMEGSWLSGDCPDSLVTDGYHWPTTLSFGIPAWFSNQTHILAGPKSPSGTPKGYDTLKGRRSVVHTVTWVGRLRTRDKYFVICRTGGDYVTFGFGNQGAAPAELVVEAILDPELTPYPPPILDEEIPPGSCPNEIAQCTNPNDLLDAVSRNCLDLVREFLTKEGIDSKNGSASEALRRAIVLGNESIVRLLLDAGAPANPVNLRIFPPLSEAALRGRMGIMKLLLARGADVDAIDVGTGGTWLVGYGYAAPGEAKILLNGHANPDAHDRKGTTALMHASADGLDASVKLLIEYKADVNLGDNTGRTALMYAASGKYVDAIPLLLAAGADPSIRDAQGKTALDLAKEVHNDVAAELLSTR